MELWTGFVLGALGGLHCAGMCGPLMLAMPRTGSNTAMFVVGRVVYQAGRISTYGVLGAACGLVGRTLLLAGVQRWVAIGLGVAMLAGLFVTPQFLALPWVAGEIGRLKATMGVFLRERSLAALAALGVLNGLLPCGLVYAACAGAAATGGWAQGSTFMLAFGLGTVPVTLAMGLSGRMLPTALRLRLRHALPVGIALMGCLLILRGLSLGIPYLSPDLAGGAVFCCPPARP
jgi:sulfite exporter TauE/SafE